MTQLSLHSPIGDLTITEEDNKIVSLDWGWSPMSSESELLLKTKFLLDQYFDGDNPEFDIPLNPHGTNFQKNVWKIMLSIPYGKSLTYGDIAKTLNSHARAVGTACGLNPIPIIIPCHRVIGANGALIGFSGGEGIETKIQLLELEEADYDRFLPF